mgnify:CR=1 FL=1
MWQRKQTLYLGIALALAALLHMLDLASYERLGKEGAVTLRLYGLYGADGARVDPPLSIPLYLVNALMIVQLVIAIALFKKRHRQLRFTRLSFLFSLGMIAGIVFTHNSVASAMGTANTVKGTLLPGAYIPFILPVLVWLAERAIKKDEELVKSAERLR